MNQNNMCIQNSEKFCLGSIGPHRVLDIFHQDVMRCSGTWYTCIKARPNVTHIQIFTSQLIISMEFSEVKTAWVHWTRKVLNRVKDRHHRPIFCLLSMFLHMYHLQAIKMPLNANKLWKIFSYASSALKYLKIQFWSKIVKIINIHEKLRKFHHFYWWNTNFQTVIIS